jgi:hypothetical protein
MFYCCFQEKVPMISGYPIVGKSLVVSCLLRWVIQLLGMPLIALRLSFVTPSNTYTGKTSAAIAEGTNHLFQKFGRPSKQIIGCCGHSGAGTPESYGNSLAALGIWHQYAAADSCGLHDLQSAFWPALQHFVGVGGLAQHHVCALQGAQEVMEKDYEGSLEESLWHRHLKPIIHAN